MGNRHLSICAGLLTLTMAACGGAPPMAMQGTPEDETTIRALASQYAETYNAGDAAALGAMAAADYQSVTPDGTMATGPAGLEAAEAKELMESESMGLQVMLSATPMFVRWINAENAIMGGTYSVSGVPEGMPNSGSWLVTVMKDVDGQWKLTSSLGATYMPPPPMPEGESGDM